MYYYYTSNWLFQLLTDQYSNMSKSNSDKLYQLINALSKPEKRYFKVYTSKQGSDNNNYHVLFDAIDKLSEPDEVKLVKTLKKANFSNALPIAKTRLYNVILKSLDSYHSNSSIDAQLKKTLHCAEILYKKSLYVQSSRLLKGAKKLAYEHEKHTTLLEIFMWEKLLIEKDNYENLTDDDILEMMEENAKAIRNIEDYNDLWGIKSRLFNILNRQGKARSTADLERFKAIMDETLVKKKKEDLYYQTTYLYNHIYSAYYFGVGDYKNSYKYLKANVEHIEKNVERFSEEPNVYFSVLTNIVYIASQVNMYDQVFFYLDKLRALPSTMDTKGNEDMDIKLFSSTYSIELTIYFLTGEFDKGVEIIPQVENGLILYEHKLNSVRRAFFYFNIAIIYFGANDYNSSLKWINKLLNDININKSEDIYCFAQLVNLLIHIELDSNTLLPYALRSTQRYLSTRNRYYKFETTVLEFIGKLLKSTDAQSTKEHYATFVEQLKPLKEDSFEKAAFEYFDFISWAESKLGNKTFAEIKREKAGLKDRL
ncbi:MAG: hypothetical protein ACI85F_001471 [Bacteroidia bacterium]